MALINSTVALTTVAGGVRVASSTVTGARLSGASLYDPVPIVMQTTAATGFYWGSSSVTTANGIFVKELVAYPFQMLNGDPIHALSSVDAVVLRICAGRQTGGTTAPQL